MTQLLAPGVDFRSVQTDQASADVLRPDIFGLAGVFERGPLFVARRIDDWGEQRAEFGGFLRLQGHSGRSAFGPLAMYGFQQNGGGTAIVVRMGGRQTLPALATLPDPASGRLVGLVASSAGAWANGVQLRLPLRVVARFAAAAFPLASGGSSGSIVRVRAASGGIAFGTLQPGPSGLELTPATQLIGPYVVETLDPTVDLHVTGPGIEERFRALSLDPASDRYVWSYLTVQAGLGPDWQPRVPAAWEPLDAGLRLALAQQGPSASRLVRALLLEVPYATPALLAPPWPAPSSQLDVSAGAGILAATLSAGTDAVKSIDVGAYRAAIELLAEHPLPSLVAIPDLLLGFSAVESPCTRTPDATRLPTPKPAPPDCGPVSETPTAAPASPLPPPEPVAEDDVPALGSSTAVALLQEELLSALAGPGEASAERIALLDCRPDLSPPEAILAAAELSQTAPRGELGMFFYPWVRILDPWTGGRGTLLVPPSGHVAGVMARTTREGGPSARFANETLNAVVDVERAFDYEERGRLNAGQIAALHVSPARGVLVLGARTLDFSAEAVRFAPAARVLAYVRRVLRVVGQTLVFEPNDRFLWLRIVATLEVALHELFLAGAFAGRTPAESYRIRCDEVTNPAAEMQLGRVITIVDVALSVPLEFISIRIAFTRDGARVLDDIDPVRAG
jgi:hypothetical protein